MCNVLRINGNQPVLARMWRKENPLVLLVGMQTGAESSMEIPQKIKMDVYPAVPLLGVYLKETKTLIQKIISTPMFTAALFTIATIWKQSKCPSVDEWIKQLQDIYTMEFYSAIKRKVYPLQQYGWTWRTLC